MTWLAASGWATAAVLAAAVLAARARLERVARAEHELRGPIAALVLGLEQVRRGRSGPDLAETLEAQLDRSRAGLADLGMALGCAQPAPQRRPVSLERLARRTVEGWTPVAAGAGRGLRIDWRAGPATMAADRGRVAQALGNLLSNAIEHGEGAVQLRGRRVGRSVRIEVLNAAGVKTPAPPRPARQRGRGLRIASSAAEEAGGSLRVTTGRDGASAVLELPLEEG